MTAKELREKAEHEKLDGLCDPTSLEIFETWYILGGAQSPPSLYDLWRLPAWLLQDVRYIYSELGDARERERSKRKSKNAALPRPRGKS